MVMTRCCSGAFHSLYGVLVDVSFSGHVLEVGYRAEHQEVQKRWVWRDRPRSRANAWRAHAILLSTSL